MKPRHLGIILLAAVSISACQQASNLDEKTQATADAAAKPAAMNEAQKAYAAANAKMHAGMGHIPPDADEAFIVGMIPHHQGAVDMANIAIAHGKDAEVRALAKSIIAAQEKEIAQMENWLKQRGIKRNSAAAAGHAANHAGAGH